MAIPHGRDKTIGGMVFLVACRMFLMCTSLHFFYNIVKKTAAAACFFEGRDKALIYMNISYF